MGKVWAWLLHGESLGVGHSPQDHRLYVPDLAARRAARRAVSAPEIGAEGWLAAERPKRDEIDGSDGEPIDLP